MCIGNFIRAQSSERRIDLELRNSGTRSRILHEFQIENGPPTNADKSHRQGKIKVRALSWTALDPNFSAVRLHDVLDDGESEAGATRVARPRLIDSIEPLKDSFARFGRNARPIVRHTQLDVPVHGAALHGH